MILLLRWRGYRDDLLRQRLLPEVQELIVEHVVLNRQLQTTPTDRIELPLELFRTLGLPRKAVRRLLAAEILHYRQNFSGKVHDLLRKLYMDLGLHRFAEKKLKQKSVQQVVMGLNELLHMDIPVNEQQVFPLLSHGNRYVREAARCYYVKLSSGEPFRFLDEVSAPILTWEQFELFRIVSQREDMPVPQFSRWIRPGSHPSVISFCLKLAVHFQQFEAVPSIIRLLSTDDLTLRAELINALGKLLAEEAEPHLLELYDSQPLECRIEILKALGRIGSGRHLDFLRREFEEAGSIELRKHAARSIVSHEALSAALLKELRETSVGLGRTVLLHSMNPLIKY